MATRAGEVERLVAALGARTGAGGGPGEGDVDGDVDGAATRRDAAIARLRVIGARALERLAAVATGDADPARRSAALKAIEGIDDRRGLETARTALGDVSAEVRVAAVAVLRAWLTRDPGTDILDTLSGLALDRDQQPAVRLACLDALADLPPHIVNPLLERAPRESVLHPELDDPQSLREWLAEHEQAPLSELHGLVGRIREREAAAPLARQEWLVTRGVVHAVLARRGSRVALYDLREAFDGARAPLPLDFLSAALEIGDETCLEPMARAWAAAPARETWWRDRLAGTAAEIMQRARLSGRSALVKRIRAKWNGFL